MTNSEHASYIRGLMDGMELDPNAKETKLFHAVVELLDSISSDLEELEDQFAELAEQVDEVDEDLGSLETEYYGLDGEEGCGCGHHHSDGGCGCHHTQFEAICPSCGETIELDEDMLDEDGMVCPHCGETLEFDFDDEEDELPFEEISSDEGGDEE